LIVRTTQQLSLRLDTSRNELLIANTVLAILACCFGLGAYVSGIFGMNLDNTGKLQDTKNVFYIVIATSFGFMILMFVGMIWVFRSNGMFPAKITLSDQDAVKLKL
jgi:Mg2+ and Co2+ transporter CorA